MKRVAIIGVRGTGKSTLARKLGKLLGIKVWHLDSLYWRPDWVPTPRADWEELERRLIVNDSWILDGDFGTPMDLRLRAADTIILLDLPARVCAWNAFVRWIKYRGQEAAPGCPERLSWPFFLWIWTYRLRYLPGVLDELAHYADARQVFVLRSRAQIRRFVQVLGQSPASPPPGLLRVTGSRMTRS